MAEFLQPVENDPHKIDQTLASSSFFSPQKKRQPSIKINCQKQLSSPKAKHSEPTAMESKYSSGSIGKHCPHQSELFHLEPQGNQSFTKRAEFEQWKRAEMQKYQEIRRVSEFSNEKLAEDKRSIRASLDPIHNKASVTAFNVMSPRKLDENSRREVGMSFHSDLLTDSHLEEKRLGMNFETINTASIRSNSHLGFYGFCESQLNYSLENVFEKTILDCSTSPKHSHESTPRKDILALAQWFDQISMKIKGAFP